MKLKRLFKALKTSRPIRKNYRIRLKIKFFVDNNNYTFALLPTIIFVPWPFRELGMPILEIAWLNFGVRLGEWDSRRMQPL